MVLVGKLYHESQPPESGPKSETDKKTEACFWDYDIKAVNGNLSLSLYDK